ncbi:MAG: ABC transporter permease subunit [Rhizobiales bacterium]|nr:ABC transporter permease subunit [Hyphomicrobiales bacterium]
MENWTKNRLAFLILALPGTFWLVVFFIAPLALIWILSFGTKTSLVDIEITGTLSNYLRAADPIYLQIIWKSIWVSAIATFLCLVIAYPVAFAISFASPRWKSLLLVAIILPFWINLLIRTYALIAVFRTRGFANFGLEWLYTTFGLHHLFGPFQPLQLLYNDFAVIVGLVYVFMPFMVLPLYATVERLDKSYLEASLDLGASQWTTFFKVTVPLTMPGIVSGIILVFIPCLGSFLTPDLLGGTNAIMIGNVIERQFKAANDWPFGAALSFLLMYVTFGALALRAVFAGRKQGMEI